MLIVVWFGVSIAAVAAVLILTKILPLVLSFCSQRWRFWFLKRLAYPTIKERDYSSSVTRLDALLLSLYIGVNALFMKLQVRNIPEAIKRSGIMASMNMIPLFSGARTSFLADRLGVPLHSYYFAHHWIGRLAVVQGIIHAILVAVSSRGFHDFPVSGAMVVIALVALFFLSLIPVRKLIYEWFLKIHFILAMASVAALLWHVLPAGFSRVIYPIAALLLWSLNTTLRLIRYFRNELNSEIKQIDLTRFHGSISTAKKDSTMSGALSLVKLDLELKRPMHVEPGQYIYLRFKDLQFRYRYQAHPFMIAWWEEEVPNNVHSPGRPKAKSLTFLIQPKSGLTSRLANVVSMKKIKFDGPYGQNLHLEDCHNVILVAKGIGIAGILAYAKQLVSWTAHPVYKRRVITRKLDIYWELDDNSQGEWVEPYLRILQQEASKTKLLQMWCYFPDPKGLSSPPFHLSEEQKQYQCFYPDGKPHKKLDQAVKLVASTCVGSTIVVACGLPEFTNEMRKIAIAETAKPHIIEFIETEYRPTEYERRGNDKQSKAAEMPRRREIQISAPTVARATSSRV